MKNSTRTYTVFLIAAILICTGSLRAQISFKNNNSLLSNPNMHSGCAITVCDMNGDGLDDIVRLNLGHDVYIEYQQPGNQFRSVHIGDLNSPGNTNSEWGMCVADVDHNGYRDILAGGNNSSKIELMLIDSSGLMVTMIDLSTASISGYFMQNANFMDVNNDGWEDIFTCNDNGPSVIWTNDGTGNFTMSNIINFTVHPWTYNTGVHGIDPADAGNYGSVWTDFDNDGDVDLYIAHCRQSVSGITDVRKIDQLFVNNGNGTYTQMDTAYGVADSLETWTASFGDIDNDGDFDLLLTEQDDSSRILINDGAGHFADMAGRRLPISEQTIESVMEDFNNDGYIDILVTGANSQLFLNNGNNTFSAVQNPFDNNGMETFAVGDLNHDGKIDLYSGYGGIYTSPDTSINDVVWLNTTNNQNNFITFHLIGTTSNMSALGARATIYGSWGKQIREVRSGESYGTCNSADLHFGLGTVSVVDSAIIRWPSGTITRIINPTINQFITIKESTCISPDNIVSANGPLIICTGQSITLNASAGHQYLWSNGSTSQSIVVTTGGDYAVTISDHGNACTSTSALKTILLNPDQTPTIHASIADTNFCQGTTVTLISTPAFAYHWSNGDSTVSTIINQSGTYSVTTQGSCQQWTSPSLSFNMYPAPAPVANTVMIPVPGTAVLTATGNHVSWYNAASGGTPLDTGLSFTTPFLNTDSVFYAEDSYSYGGAANFTGEPYHTGNDYSGTTANGYIIFDVTKPCILKTVKVYTDNPGDRLIELRDYNDVVLQSIMVNIPMDSSTITLNFNLTPGNGYHIGTNAAQNNALLGYVSPRLKRSDSGVNYPYTINNFLTVNNSSAGTSYYYYFYNWEVDEPSTVCVSDRIPVQVIVISTGINNVNGDRHIKLYPNPAKGNLNVTFNESITGETTISIADLSGRIVSRHVYGQISNGQTILLGLDNLAPGAYMVSVNNDNTSFTRSITIMQ